MVFTLTCKAVGAVKVACVCYVKAKSLDNTRSLLLELTCHRREVVGGKEFALFLELLYLIVALFNIKSGYIISIGELLGYYRKHLVATLILEKSYDLIRDLVNRVDRA